MAGAPIERPQPSGPKIGPPHSSAPHPSEPAASTPTAGTAPINFHARADGQRVVAPRHRHVPQPVRRARRGAVAVQGDDHARPDHRHGSGSAACSIASIRRRAATNPGLELQVGTKSAVYDPASNLALYANDIAIAADWDGNDSIDDVDKIRDYLQAVLDRISD